MEPPTPTVITEVEPLTYPELQKLAEDLGISSRGSDETLSRKIFTTIINPRFPLPEVTKALRKTLRRFALALTGEEIATLCKEETILSRICNDRHFWIQKILRDFKEDKKVLESYEDVEQLKEIYYVNAGIEEEKEIEDIKDQYILPVSQFLKLKTYISRAGIIPIIKRGKYKFYGLGLDQGSGDITEFAGRKDPEDRDLLETALRELEEESLEVIPVTREMVEKQNNDVLFDFASCIFLVEINNKNMMDLVNEFNEKIQEKKKRREKIENGLLFWVTEGQLRSLLAIQRPDPDIKFPVFFHYRTRKLLTFKFGNINNCK
jgi:hypothetical protein